MINKKKLVAIIAVNQLLQIDSYEKEKVNWTDKRVGWIYNKNNPFNKIQF